MSNNTTEKSASPRRRRAFRHLTDSDRQLIETWYKKRVSIREIARRLNVSHSTGSREIKGGMVTHIDTERREFRTYSADYASERHAENMTAKGPNLKIGCDYGVLAFSDTPQDENPSGLDFQRVWVHNRNTNRINALWQTRSRREVATARP